MPSLVPVMQMLNFMCFFSFLTQVWIPFISQKLISSLSFLITASKQYNQARRHFIQYRVIFSAHCFLKLTDF